MKNDIQRLPARPWGAGPKRPPARPSHAALVLCLLLAFAAGGPAGAAAEAASEQPELGRRAEAAYQFALAKLLAEESAFDRALAAYDRALELEPDDPYTTMEKGKFHAYLAQLSRSQAEAMRHAAEARTMVDRSRELAPENLEVLAAYAQVHLQLADWDSRSVDRSREAYEQIRAADPENLEALIPLGQIYLWERKFDQAAEVLAAADGLRPGQRMILTMRMEALLQAGRLDEAEPVLEGLLRIDPSSVENRLRLVELRSRRGDHRGALAVLEEAPEAVGEGAHLRQRMARELHATGENPRALEVVAELLAEQPEREDLQRLEIAVLSAMGRDREALTKLRATMQASADEESRLRDRLLASRLLERQGRSAEAVEELRGLLRAEAGGERRWELVALLAGALERQGDTAAAIELLRAELGSAKGENLVLVAGTLSDLEQRSGEPGRAQRTLESGIEALVREEAPEAAEALRLRQLTLLARDERWPELLETSRRLRAGSGSELAFAARLLEADALVGLGREDEALAVLAAADDSPGRSRQLQAKRVEVLLATERREEALEEVAAIVAEGEAADLYFASQILQRARRYEESLPLLARLLEQQPDSSAALFLLGAAQERTGRFEAAVESFERLLALVPDHPQALNYLGYMWAEKGENLPRALELVRRAVALDPDNGAYLDSLGWALYQLGHYEDARRHLEWAAKLVPEDPTVLEHLGDVLLSLGERDRARAAYLEAQQWGGEDAERLERKVLELGSGGR